MPPYSYVVVDLKNNHITSVFTRVEAVEWWYKGYSVKRVDIFIGKHTFDWTR